LIAGGSPMNKFIARKVISAFQETPVVHTLSELSERENEILQLLATGLLVKEVSEKLCLSAHTIKSHMRNIYTKLHVNNRVEAINKLNNQK
jgi:DNA-binding NarL/FixJ family response regulator